jgi:hypothetical protein
MLSNVSARFLLPVPDHWSELNGVENVDGWNFLRAAMLETYTAELAGYYLSHEAISGRLFVGGFSIVTDGESWNRNFMGEFWQTMQWFSGLSRLTQGENRVLISVFEDSKMILHRNNNHLTMYETWEDHYPRTDFCPEIAVDFQEFSQQLICEGLIFADWAKKMQDFLEQERQTQESAMESLKKNHLFWQKPSKELPVLKQKVEKIKILLPYFSIGYRESILVFKGLLENQNAA